MNVLSGQRAWILQRITAVYVGVYTVLALVFFVIFPPTDYSAWVQWISQPMVLLTTLLFIFLLLLHAWIGLRDVILDYLRPVAIRFSALSIAGLGLVFLGFWASWILMRVSLS